MSASQATVRLGAELGAELVSLDGNVVVIRPGGADQVAFAMRVAREERLGLRIGSTPPRATAGPSHADRAGDRGLIHLLPDRLSALLHLDESSLLVHAHAGMRLDALAVRLAATGMTLGPLPERSLGRTLGALIAAPRPSEATPRGRLVDLCAAVDAVLPDATMISTHLAPRKATGPDLLYALVGARGTTGIITAVWLRVARRPPRRLYAGYAIDGDAALHVARELLRRGARPADLAIADVPASARSDERFAALGVARGEVLLAVHFDGTPELLAAEQALAHALATAARGRALPPPLIEAWWKHAPGEGAEGEAFVAMGDLARRWAARVAPAMLSGVRPAGAALRSAVHAAASPAPDAAASVAVDMDMDMVDMVLAVRAQLARRLDPNGLLSTAALPSAPAPHPASQGES